MPRIAFKTDPKAPKPYCATALRRFMRAESKRFEKEIVKIIGRGSPWFDLLLFTGGTFQVFLGKKKPSWL